ncbi:S8 family serine peptidase [Actinophytocola xanthii]|uniref:Peptidase S8/S53 domain-containing protein n=1 Tax=Actinophytocola xanthii TaxID=1912961 RepID=A0A1Q8CV84_9PSEU|nr:S8 family serine peptidase [Actinophytocola xanthii]OLF18259.1 hypothetical protein BU204_06775 [Actinophytocola xanthii]
MNSRPLRRCLLALGIALSVTAGVVLVGNAAEPANPAEPARSPVAEQVTQVTMITGDRVLASTSSLRVEFADPLRPRSYQQLTIHGDRYLIPADAAALIDSGTLDRELFNITGLVRQGYDDRHSASIPLLTRDATVGDTGRNALPAVGITASRLEKSHAATAWRDITGVGTRRAGTARIWLDREVTASTDASVPRIGARAAWERGLTGRGVTVAVLDTGIDTDHPDFAGRVRESRDFTGAGGVEDRNGHGTHVASVAAGTGAASGGRYRGVAPEADLAIGKVLDDEGRGTMSSVLAGMVWAAAETDADVVNLSLGADATDGTDPLSVAVDTLSAEHDTLFVAATGNDGADRGVATPAAANTALAVGSVGEADAPSPFSNRGPRLRDGVAKPDLAAPGEGIVAAAPADVPPLGEPVGEAYQRMDGTSMAAPHVSGAAALLAQQHRDWTPDRLKAALTSTATETSTEVSKEASDDPHAVGTGRVDIDRATRQSVIATGSVSAFLAWPTAGRRETRAVTWHNSGTEPVTLSLAAELRDSVGGTAPAGMLTLSADTVTVAPGADAEVEVTVAATAPGTYAGTLVATGPDGLRTRTTLSVEQEPEMYDLTVHLVNRDGAPATGDRDGALALALDDPRGRIEALTDGTARVPAGRYSVTARIRTPVPGREASLTVLTHPELVVDRDTEITLDARTGQPASISPDNPAARGGSHLSQVITRAPGCACVLVFYDELEPRSEALYVGTAPGTSSDGYAFALSRQATEPRVELHVDGPDPFEVAADWFDTSPVPTERGNLRAVYAGRATPAELAALDVRGKLVLFDMPPDTTYGQLRQTTLGIRDAGASLAMVVAEGDPAPRAAGEDDEVATALPTLWGGSVSAGRFRSVLAEDEASVRFASTPHPALRYELWIGVTGRVTTPQVHRPRTRDLAAVATSYHDNGGQHRFLGASAHFFGTTVSVVNSYAITAPQQRTEYFTPGEWALSVHGSLDLGQLSETRRLHAGRNRPIEWDRAVIGPSFRGTTLTGKETGGPPRPRPWAWRTEDVVDVVLPMHGDAAGRPRVPSREITGSISLYREDALVATVDSPTHARIEVLPAAARYRLTATATRTAAWWPLATTVSADWTFRSSGAEPRNQPLPLLTARFAPELDLANRAPGGRRFSFPSYVERQDGEPEVVGHRVEVSYDDGASWRQAQVRRSGKHWEVTVTHPASGFVSLRATATDSDGNTVRQTVLRAYQLG